VFLLTHSFTRSCIHLTVVCYRAGCGSQLFWGIISCVNTPELEPGSASLKWAPLMPSAKCLIKSQWNLVIARDLRGSSHCRCRTCFLGWMCQRVPGKVSCVRGQLSLLFPVFQRPLVSYAPTDVVVVVCFLLSWLLLKSHKGRVPLSSDTYISGFPIQRI
jgi:hypothetical protein